MLRLKNNFLFLVHLHRIYFQTPGNTDTDRQLVIVTLFLVPLSLLFNDQIVTIVTEYLK